MREVIDRGHLFIAQPPLFKVNQGKRETYIKDEGELSKYLMNRVAEGLSLESQAGSPLSGDALLALLAKLEEFRAHARRLESRGMPRPVIDLLLAENAVDRTILTNEEKVRQLAAAFEASGVADAFVERDETHDGFAIRLTMRQGGARSVMVNFDSLSQYEIRQTAQLFQQIAASGLPPYSLHHGDHVYALASFDEVIEQIYELAKKGLYIQRYKGLGEMNPEQLWETTMNPETRRLLQVRIEDGVAAEQMFTVLMGDQVEPRRDFIQRNALEVTNLDI
jgi:DNA gyrase subunit B